MYALVMIQSDSVIALTSNLCVPHWEIKLAVEWPFSQFLQVWRPDRNHEHPRYVALDGLVFPFRHETDGQLLCNDPQVPSSRADLHSLQTVECGVKGEYSHGKGLISQLANCVGFAVRFIIFTDAVVW